MTIGCGCLLCYQRMKESQRPTPATVSEPASLNEILAETLTEVAFADIPRKPDSVSTGKAEQVLGALVRALDHGALSMNPSTLIPDIREAYASFAATPSGGEPIKLKNLKMLDAIHQIVMQYSGNKELADKLWGYLRFDSGKGAVAPPTKYEHLSPSGGGEWTRETIEKLESESFHAAVPFFEALAAAHNASITACYCCRERTCQPGCRCADMLETKENPDT